jgi:putative sterol carrier protein
MEKKIQYLSPEWAVEAGKRLRAELTPDKMNQITSSMSNIYTNCPDGKDHYLFLKMVDGAFETVETGIGVCPQAEFVITGTYEVYAKISQALLGSQLALMTGKLKLKGNMVKALKLAKVSDRINKVFATIPAEY